MRLRWSQILDEDSYEVRAAARARAEDCDTLQECIVLEAMANLLAAGTVTEPRSVR